MAEMMLDAPLTAHPSIRGIGGSDIQRIYKGDWHQLWLEKTGRAKPEDLTWKLPVQVGRALEPVILAFYTHETGRRLFTGVQMKALLPNHDSFDMPDGRHTAIHPNHPWAIGSFDGLSVCIDGPLDKRIVEAKTTNYWNATKQTPEFLRSYAPQQQWYLEVGALNLMDFVFLVDNQRVEVHTVERDECFASVLLGEAEEFWEHVVRDIEPRKGRPERKAPAPKVALSKTYDMVTRKEGNAWVDAAGRWLNNQMAAAAYLQAAQDLKELIPSDAKKAVGGGIIATRDKAGRVMITRKEAD